MEDYKIMPINISWVWKWNSNWFISALLKIPREPRVMNVAPVCLPESIETKNETFNGINCIATGWGQMEMKGPLQAQWPDRNTFV